MDQEMDSDTNSSLRTRTQSSASSESESVSYTTTSGRLFDTANSLSPRAKKRVDSADAPFNNGRCLILNYPDDRTVQYCHMIPRKRAKDEKLMTALEWHWNMPHKSLHLNTRYNNFFAGSPLHLYHDSGAWGLAPDKAIIDQYYDALPFDRSKFPDIQLPQNGFEYTLIPLGNSMKNYPILRQNDHTLDLPLNEDQFTLHFYPFQSLPPFHSHLHPKFAIYELGRKFEILTSDATEEAISLYPDFKRIFYIYAVWKGLPQGRARGFKEWRNEDDTKGDGDRQSETSSKTGYDSWRKGVKRKQEGNADAPPPSATPAGGNSNPMQIANPSFGKLSRKTLVKHECVYGKGGWTPESLSSWVADASRRAASDIMNVNSE